MLIICPHFSVFPQWRKNMDFKTMQNTYLIDKIRTIKKYSKISLRIILPFIIDSKFLMVRENLRDMGCQIEDCITIYRIFNNFRPVYLSSHWRYQGGYGLLKKKVRTFQELFKNIPRIFQEHNF